MTFVDAIKVGFKNFANFKGTASRSEFWYWVLFTTLVGLVLDQVDTVSGLGGATGLGLSSIASLVFLVPNLAVTFRRLHDAGFSGWLYALNLVPAAAAVWFVLSFINDFQASGLPTDNESLSAALNEFVTTQTGPIYDALVSGTFNNTATSLLSMLISALAVGVAFIIFYTRPTKSAAQGNRYASAAPAPQINDGGTTA